MTKATPKRRQPAALRASGLNAIEQVPIDLLKPYAGDARTHDQRQLA